MAPGCEGPELLGAGVYEALAPELDGKSEKTSDGRLISELDGVLSIGLV